MEVADEVVGPAPAARGTSLVLSPHPLTLAGRTITAAELLPGETLAAYLLRHEVDLDRGDWMVCVGGAAVPRALWARTRPHHGQVVECRRMAGKDVARFAAFVVLAWATGGLSAYFEAGSLALYAAQATVFLAGAYLINRVLPPSLAKLRSYDNKTGSTYSLSGGRNRARPYEPLGLLFGTTKVVPDYAALPYTWFESETQMLSTRFSAGVNTASVASLKIGATAIESYADVVVQKVGFPSGNTALIDWANVDTVAGGALDAPTAPGAWVTRTSSAGSTTLALDITAQLYSMADNGAMNTASVLLDIEMRELPSGSWATVGSVALTSKSTAPLRLTRTYTLTPPGQYEVRMRKATANVATTRAANVVEWVALKSYQADVTDFDDYPQVSLRMRATGQLNGVLDELNWVATSKAVPVWNGAAWVTEATRNPGAHMLAFMRGISDSAGRMQAGMGLPDAQIDIDSLKGFMVHCAAQGYVFDDWLDEGTGCLEYLDAMAAVGLGSMSRHTGKLGVVWLASGQPIEAVVNMATMKPGSFRVEYATRAVAEELEVSWFERTADYAPKSLRLLAPGITTPRETARLAPRGVTTEAGAVRMARLAMAQNLYGRKLVSWDTDLEHLAYRRYSLVALSHDLTQWGYGGRLQAAVDAAGTVTLTLDEEVPANATRYIGLRIPGESGYRVFGVAAFAGTTRTVVLTGAWPGGVPLPGDSAANPAHDTIWIYDFKAEPGLRLRITAVEPNADMKGARVTAVPEPDEFWTFMASGSYTVAATPASAAPASATNLQVSQRRLDLNATNDIELTMTWTAGGAFDSAQVWGSPVGQPLVLLGDTRLPRFGPVLVGPDGNYQIEVRPFDQLGRPGAVLSGTYSLVLGTMILGPTTYTWFAYATNSDGTAGFTTGAWAGQTYLGIAANKSTATEGTNPADYTWSLMKGADGQGVFTLVLSSGLTFSGGVLQKTGGGTGWNEQAYSVQSYRDSAYVSFSAGGAGSVNTSMGGLNSDPTTDASWPSLDFAWYVRPDENCYVYEGGSTVAGPFSMAVDDVFTIVADGDAIRYYQNATLQHISATSPSGRTFYFDSSFPYVGGSMRNLVFGPTGRRGTAVYTWVAYANNSSGTTGFTTGAWSGQTYLGLAANKTTSTESTNPADYVWSLMKGDQGDQGLQGIPGNNGTDGTTTYTWVAYANNSSGTTGFTTGAWSGQTYLGLAANKTTSTESTNPADYVWSLMKGDQGDQGLQGIPGNNGTDGTTTYTWVAYANNSSGTTGFTTGAWSGQTYLGLAANKTTSTESTNPADYVWSLMKGDQGDQGLQGIPGNNGTDGTTTYTWVAYANNSSGTTGFTTGAWSGQTYLGLAANKTTSTESTNPADYVWSLMKGDQGDQGLQGIPGNNGTDGTTTYTWVAYANNSSGTTGFTTGAWSGQTYLGLAANKTTSTESTNPADYVWSLMKGDQGDQGLQGIPGNNGTDGTTTYTWVAYANNSSGTTGFTTGAWSGQTYLGLAANKTTSTESTNPADYVWSLMKGDQGDQGLQGIPGNNGTDGTTTYTWVAYANNSSGTTGFTTGAWSGQTYLGLAANKTTSTESTNPADYVWSLMKGDQGDQGLQGIPGNNGTDGTTTYTWVAYANNSSGTTGFTTGAWSGQTYLGLAANKTTSTESTNPADYVWSLMKGDQGDQGLQGIPGNNGTDGTTTYTWVAYANNSSGTTGFTTGAWSGQTYLGLAANKTTSTESTNPADYVWSLMKGDQGDQGLQGIPGNNGTDGTTTYTWVAYANNSSGTTGFTTGAWSGQTYLGLAANKTTSTESTNPADYVWSLMKGDQGDQGLQGIPGNNGTDGTTTYTWVAYANNSSGTTGFTTGAWSGQTYLGLAANKTTSTESTNPADYVWSLMKGDQGDQGLQGIPGNNGTDGTTTYTWVAYANNSSGTTGFTTGAWSGQTYLGLAANKTTSTESTNPADYVWSRMEGPQGPDGAAAVSVGADKAAVVLAADSAGVVDSGLLPTTVTAWARSGTTDDTGSWSWTRSATGGITTTLAGAAVTITAMSIDSGEVTIIGTRSGYSTISVTVPVTKAKRSTPNAGPVTGVTLYAETYTTGPTDAVANVYFLTDGRIFVTDSFGWSQQGTWYAPTTTGIGSDYDVRFDVTGSDGNSGGLTGNAEGARARMDSNRYAELTTTEDSSSYRSRTLLYRVFRRSDDVQVSSGTIWLIAGVDV